MRLRFAAPCSRLDGELAHAQQASPLHGVPGNTTVLPVLTTKTVGRSVLLIEPSTLPQLPSQRIISPAPPPSLRNHVRNGLQLRAG